MFELAPDSLVFDWLEESFFTMARQDVTKNANDNIIGNVFLFMNQVPHAGTKDGQLLVLNHSTQRFFFRLLGPRLNGGSDLSFDRAKGPDSDHRFKDDGKAHFRLPNLIKSFRVTLE